MSDREPTLRAGFLVLLTLVVTGSAEAKSLALAGSYGDDYGCKVAQLGEVDAAGLDEPNDWILVMPKGAQGHEWSCDFQSRRGSTVTAACYGEGFDSSQTVTVVENCSTGTLTYTDMAGTFTLHRCP